MPKASKRKAKKSSLARSNSNAVRQNEARHTASANSGVADRRFVSPRVAGPQSLVMPMLVALGCWGMAISLVLFYTDPNRFLFAGMAVLMALLWTYSVIIRMRKLLAQRQKV